MSDRITIRDAVIAKITAAQPTYLPAFMKDFSTEVTKGKPFDIVVILGDEEINEVLMEGVRYNVNTMISIQTMVRGDGQNGASKDIQATLETIHENIYNALMEWKTITTDIFSRVKQLDYVGMQTTVFGNSPTYGGFIDFEINYDKN